MNKIHCNEKSIQSFFENHALRLLVQAIIFVFSLATAYYALKTDIALLNQKVLSNEQSNDMHYKNLLDRIIRIDEKLDRLIERK